MLQPVELHAVSRRFAREIAGLRTFLSLAAVPLDTDRAMPVLAERVAGHAAFHRDLTSHIWVLLDEGEPSIRQADLLGMLALAACGAEHAARTQEHDALTLLRFVMEAKHTLERGAPAPNRSALAQPTPGVSRPVPLTTTRVAPGQPTPDTPPRSSLPEAPAAVVVSSSSSQQAGEPANRRPQRRRLVYVSAAACSVAVLLIVLSLLRRHTERGPVSRMTAGQSVPSPGSAATGQAALTNDSGVVGSNPANSRAKATVRGRADTPESFAPSNANVTSSSSSFPARADLDSNRLEPPASLAAPSAASAAPLRGNGSTPVPAGALPNVIAAPAVALARPRSGASVPVAVPPEILSKRLDSPTLPAYATGADDTGRKYPRLLRRHTSASGADPTLTAELRAPDLSSPASSQRVAGSSAPVRGFVRSACLGMMASNLIYGPTPAYPAAAAAAHVQGQVTIQANIDRDGAVNSARVVSGPPMLRDAAMDAVQRWRYRPFLTGGKPSPTGATAVVDFELQ